MEQLLEYGYTVPIAILYNSLFYQITNILYRNSSLIEKRDNSIVILLIGSILGIIFVNLTEEKNNAIFNGIKYGSYFLLVSTFINFWPFLSDELKLFGSLICFSTLIYYYNQKSKK
jgi:uncharacterized membrane protein YjfL (UPF0719 family)